MKLNNKIIKEMLLQIENDVDGSKNFAIHDYRNEKFAGYPPDVARYHMNHLVVEGHILSNDAGYFWDISAKGRDFLKNHSG